MDSKKRKTDLFLDEEEEDNHHANMAVDRSRKAPNLTQRSTFARDKKALYQQGMEELQEAFQRTIATASPEHLILAGAEYKRCARVYQKLYHPPSNARLLAMGADDCYQLGITEGPDDDKKDEYTPTLTLGVVNNIAQVDGGGLHTVMLSTSGSAYACGGNDDWALGHVVEEERQHLVLKIAGNVTYTLRYTLENQIDPKDNVAKTREIKETKVYEPFQEHPEDKDQLVQVSAGDSHTLFLSIHGRVYMCGTYKEEGESGKFATPQVGQTLKSHDSHAPVPTLVKLLGKPAIKIASGNNFSAAILNDCSLVTWGMDTFGALARSRTMKGAKMIRDVDFPEHKVYDIGKYGYYGETYTVENREDKKDKDGYITLGEIRNPDKPERQEYRFFYDLIQSEYLTPAPVVWSTMGRKEVLDVACCGNHIVAVAREWGSGLNNVFSAGLNAHGQLGLGDQRSRHEMTLIEGLKGKHIVQVACGSSHCLALNAFGTSVYAWGRADVGALGLDHEFDKPSHACVKTPQEVIFPTTLGDDLISEVAAGQDVSFAVTANGQVYSWGYVDMGATGHACSDWKSVNVPTPFLVDAMRNYPGEEAHVFSACGGGQHSLFLFQYKSKNKKA